MEFSSRRKKPNSNSQTEIYGHALQFYGQPPLENISLSEFETFAVDRLKCKTFILSNEILIANFALSIVFFCCCVMILYLLLFIMSSFIVTAVLKTIENLGVSYVKLSEQYSKKLENESKILNFPYRSDVVSIYSMKYIRRILECSRYQIRQLKIWKYEHELV